MRRLYFTLVAVLAVYACSEATDGLQPYDVVISSSPATDGGDGTTGEEPTAETPPKTFDAATVTTGVVLLNEIGVGDEWVEIVNSGNAEVDLGGWQVADRDKNTGEPKLADAVTFPPGTKLAPNSYALVKAGGVDGGKPCPTGGQKYCFHAEFGISNKNGETIFLIATDGGVLGSAVYPPDAANGDDISWGRLPNGDAKGAFALTPATPGAPNSP